MTKQEENWMLMTVLQIPWSECSKITDKEDRDFLIEKANELKQAIIKQQQQQQAQSSIVSPSEVLRA
tara:strand:+ start:1036 stop:1236 length:201 start_codon:yes stop_codon:yes gene_type:complete